MTTTTDNPQGTLARDKLPASDAVPAQNSRRARNPGKPRDTRSGNTQAAPDARPAQDALPAQDTVTIPVSGLLDITDGKAFIRGAGYQRGPSDTHLSLTQVRQYGLRRGDQIAGAARPPRPGKARERYAMLTQLDSVNGLDPQQAAQRPHFAELTPLYPQQRLRLETPAGPPTARIIDLIAPIGKGQRGLIVAPPKAGKTMVLQALAAAVTANHPEVQLMVILVGERPEEVTELRRSVHGEVISATFDEAAEEHIAVAELAIERAKRLVELGCDVVVLLDSITRLGRAYNLAAPASSRILAGGVAVGALYPPRKFLGAGRNTEDGGSLTLLCTALVDTGSRMDDVFFEEFKGTGNMELRLRRDLADKRVFPAIDVLSSSTRREDLLLAPGESAVTGTLRRVLAELGPQQAVELLLDKSRDTTSNAEFLRQIQLSGQPLAS
jgi:transcription termination factor Rho